MRRLLSLILLSFLLFSFVPMLHLASASGSFNPPTMQMGQFEPDPQAKNYGAYPSDIGKWFSASWGINQAYQVGAVNNPYTFLYGNFYQNGQEVVQPVQVSFTINWTVFANHAGAVEGTTYLGAPNYDSFSGGVGYDNLPPIEIFFIQQGKEIFQYNVSTTGTVSSPGASSATYVVPSFYPTSASNGSFYVVFETMMLNFWNANIGYEPIYIGEGQYEQLNAHVSGTPTTVVDSKLTGASAQMNWSFSAGEWNATFVHYLNNNPGDTSPSNIQTLQYYNFTYAGTGGIVHLRYNFSSSSPSGVYGWRMHEGITDYGTSFIVYNNATSVSSGDKPPMVSIWIKPKVAQGSTETITVLANDLKNSSIDLMVSVWFGNDLYTVPNPSYSNVIYYFAPYNVTSGQNISISFVATFYGEINVEVVSHNSFNQWNNSYRSSIIATNIIHNDTGGNLFPGSQVQWLSNPLSGPLNFILLVAGVGVLVFSIHRSGIESQAIKRAMRGLGGPGGGMFIPTHYMSAILLIFLSFVNWSYIFTAITSWGGGIP